MCEQGIRQASPVSMRLAASESHCCHAEATISITPQSGGLRWRSTHPAIELPGSCALREHHGENSRLCRRGQLSRVLEGRASSVQSQ